MNAEQAVSALNAIDGGDPEGAHCEADDILLSLAPPEVAAAYACLIERCAWWACA